MKVRFLDLRIQDEEVSVILKAIEKVLRHGKLVMGPELEQFEETVSIYCSRKYSVGVGSGTDALFLSIKALGIGPGDEVITTSLSWIATSNAIRLSGATPVFADINSDLNIDLDSIASLITSKTRAILFVNFTGQLCDIEGLQKIAEKNGLHLIEDASQSFGASKGSQRSGSFGIISAISHNPMKVFAATGEAGSVLCNDEDIYDRLLALRYNGTINRETCIVPSLNGRMDTIQAAILSERLKTVDSVISSRRRNASVYFEKLIDFVKLPEVKDINSHVFYTFTIMSNQRDALKSYLESKGVETKIQHPLLMPQQPAYKNSIGNWKKAEKYVSQILSIPIHEKLTLEEINYVSETIQKFGPSIPHSI